MAVNNEERHFAFMNDLFYRNLGKKIKEQRKSKKITQEALCGSHLNRSMLSQIENGNVHPSIDTLLFLSKKLETPLSYLMCETKKEETQYKRMQTIAEIRRLYGNGQYLKCAGLCRMEIEEDDEIAFILSQCELMLAGACMERSSLVSAENHIAAAQIAVQDTLYGSVEVRAQCSFFRLLIQAVENQQIPTPDTLLRLPVSTDPSFMLYLTLLSHIEHDQQTFSPSLSNRLIREEYRNYIMARLCMQTEDFLKAYQLLKPVCFHPPGFFTEFFALRDLEYCCQKTENYKEAYEFTKKRLLLTEQYGK